MFNSGGIATVQRASALTHCADWVHSLAGHRYPNLDIAYECTAIEIDIPAELTSASNTGDNARLLLSMVHSAANNLLSEYEAPKILPVVFQNSNRKIFQALIAGQSPATKAIARTSLPGAIGTLDCSLVSALLDTGLSPDSYVGNYRRRPLQISIASQSMEITELLLDRGADVNLRFSTTVYDPPIADTPLKAAIKTCDLDLVQLLLQARAHVNDPDSRYELSPLNVAARTGVLKIVQLVLNAGAEVNEPRRGFH
jgi:ankyrin repeat protein